MEWKLHFDLQEGSDASQDFLSLVELDVDINDENHPLAKATAQHGLDDQRSQVEVAGDTAKAALDGSATKDEAEQDAQSVIAVRNPASPTAFTPAA